jgi:hypothetical protein
LYSTWDVGMRIQALMMLHFSICAPPSRSSPHLLFFSQVAVWAVKRAAVNTARIEFEMSCVWWHVLKTKWKHQHSPIDGSLGPFKLDSNYPFSLTTCQAKRRLFHFVDPSSPWYGLADVMRGTFHVPESWPTTNRHLPGCVACGYGDNSAHHWGRFCIVPILVVNPSYQIPRRPHHLTK